MDANVTNEQEISASNDYSKYGIKDVPKFTKTTALGKTKTFAGLFHKEWFFLVSSLINITTAIGLTLYRMIVVLQSDDSQSPDFTFTLLLLINAAFCIYYVLHGVLRERVFELYAFMAAILVVALYCILEYFVFNPTRQTPVKLARLILAATLSPPNIYLAWTVSKNFGYLQFKIVGANKELQRLYQQAALFSCLLKFDLQAASSIVILALKDGTNVSTLETVSLAIGLPYSLMWCILGWVSLRRESKCCAITFAALGVIKPAYYIYKIVQEYVKLKDPDVPTTDTIVYSIIAAVSLGFLVWAMLMIELWFVYKNFNKGLKTKVFTTKQATNDVTETSGLLRPSRARQT